MTDDDLTAAVARLRDDISPGYPRTGWHDDVRLILSALEAAQADAARYRWLRNPDSDTSTFIMTALGKTQLVGGAVLDAAIDAAMGERHD